MLIVLSPAKTLDFERETPSLNHTTPRLLEDSQRIMQALQKKSVNKLMDLQGISKALAELNYQRNQEWNINHTENNAKPAISVFQGDVYVGLNEADFEQKDYEVAQNHLRILSGLYGVLRPFDVIQPYRLEMGTSLKTTRGKNLYEFWKMRITDLINDDLKETDSKILVNLASDEYFKAIKTPKLYAQVIQPVFMDKKNGKYKVLSFFAKKARGMMARFVVKNRIENVEDLKSFDSEGYLFRPELSSETKWVFGRDQE
jgi:cytoplasmic iron level regulating protein YaaA (DUF328/UPF0246 family)